MRRLADLVQRRAFFAILVPLGLLCLALVLLALWIVIDTANRRVANRGVDQALMIGRIMEVHREEWDLRMKQLERSATPGELALFWDRNVPEVCLQSIWSDSGLVASWPAEDLLPPGKLKVGDWSGVETNPRCDGPAIRSAFELEDGGTGVVALQLMKLVGQIRPIDRPGAFFESAVVDSSGYPVLSWGDEDATQSDPQGRLAGSGRKSKGTYWRGARLYAWSSAPVPSTPWFLVIRIQALDFARQMFPLAGIVLLLIGGVALLSRKMSSSVSDMVARPIADLSERVKGLEDEKWSAASVSSGLVEIDDLERSFDGMARLVREREGLRRKDLELRTRQLEERGRQLTLALTELESFSYSVSHDLRAPLRAIDGFSLVLQEDAIGRLLPEEVDALGRIRSATGRMSKLIDDLLSLSKATRAPLARGSCDMGSLVREIVAGIVDLEPDRDVSWVIGELGVAKADPGLVRQVWSNLLSNAFKFTSKRSDARVEVSMREEGGGLVWTVSDNGAGFAVNNDSKLFQPFRRFHSDAEFPGTGIGLALVRRIVERHGGTVGIESKEGEGTRAWFRLPGSIESRSEPEAE